MAHDPASQGSVLERSTVAARHISLTVVWVFLIALWPADAWHWHAISLGALLAQSLYLRLPARGLWRRALVVWLFSGVIALGLVGQPGWQLDAGNLLLKSSLSLWAVTLLVHATPLPELIAGLRRLRLPAVWTEALAFWSRYYSVLAIEWHRLQLARRARTFDPDRRRQFVVLANSLGLLFIRAYERAEQVHRAMLARGYLERT